MVTDEGARERIPIPTLYDVTEEYYNNYLKPILERCNFSGQVRSIDVRNAGTYHEPSGIQKTGETFLSGFLFLAASTVAGGVPGLLISLGVLVADSVSSGSKTVTLAEGNYYVFTVMVMCDTVEKNVNCHHYYYFRFYHNIEYNIVIPTTLEEYITPVNESDWYYYP